MMLDVVVVDSCVGGEAGYSKGHRSHVKEKTAEKQQKKTIARGDDCGH
jgi:hypothetical protein